MKKFFALALGAALLTGAQAASAAPLLTMSIDNPTGTAAQCSAMTGGTGSLVGTTCSASSTTGLVTFVGSYGSVNINFDAGNSAPDPFRVEPELWLNYLMQGVGAGTTTLSLSVTGYTSPSNGFVAKLLPSLTSNSGASGTINYYFDATNSSDPSSAAGAFNQSWAFGPLDALGLPTVAFLNNANGTYSQEWVLQITGPGVGIPPTIGGALEVFAVPAPAPLALLGLGLAALAGISRRRKLGPRA